MIRFLAVIAIVAVAGCSVAAAQPGRINGPAEGAVPPADGTLNLLTYNAGLMRVAFLGVTFYQPAAYLEERFAALPEALLASGADIIALQEVFGRTRKETLAAAVRATYRFAAWWDATSPVRLSSGLMVLSKWPITTARYARFAANPIDEKMFTRKGFLEVVIEPANQPRLRLFDFHMTAGGNTAESAAPSTQAIRAKQIGQVLEAAALPFEGTTILLGDLNAGPGASDKNYRQVLAAGYADTFAAANGGGANAGLLTWDPSQPLIANGPRRNTAPRRIDHVFLPDRDAGRVAVESARIVFTENSVPIEGGRRVPVSDHYGVQVSLRLQNE